MSRIPGPKSPMWPLAFALVLGGCPDSPTRKTPPNTPPTAASIKPSLLPLPELKPDPRELLLGRTVATALPRYHLLKRPLDDAVSVPAFDEFIKALDSAKLYLLKGDVEALRQRGLTSMDDQLRAGNLRLARQGAAMLRSRRKEASQIIAELLKKPFDFSKREVVETDPDKLAYARDQKELRDAWRKLLKLQVLQRIGRMEKRSEALAKIKDKKEKAKATKAIKPLPTTFEGREAKARKDLATTYSARAKRWKTPDALLPASRFIQAIASSYDPHTSYLPPATKENFDIEMSGSLEGIGAALSEKDHFIVVRYLVPGGASWRQKKLEAGDVILAVAQEDKEAVDVEDMPLSDVVKMIRGPKGTVVTLTVKKPDDRVEVIAITRDVVVLEEGYARGLILDLGGKKTGYIDLPSFYGDTRATPQGATGRNATDDVRAILVALMAKPHIDSVILDLRGNGGGLLNHATGISGLFIDQGPVVQASSGDGDANEVHRDDDPGVSFDGRVIVLVDRFSASASEIVAGALQDYGRALIVGTGPTHGKGTVQVLLGLDRFQGSSSPLGVLKITTQQYFRINGDSTQVRGVVPDVLLPDPSAYFESRERFRDHAIAWSKTRPLQYKPWDKETWNKAELVEQSKARVSKDPVFSKLSARVQLLRKRDKETAFPLQLAAWRGRRARDQKALEAVDPKLDKLEARFGAKTLTYRKDSAPRDDPRLKKDDEKRLMLLRRDPWIHEALQLLASMRQGK